MLDEQLSKFFSNHNTIEQQEKFAVGVSGGPDSMALAHSLVDWAAANKREVYILTVDHGLREEAKQEAKMVAEWASIFPNVVHAVLNWQDDKPETAIMEAARKARYHLMAQYCQKKNIQTLFLGHHQDDQAETFLIRLAKGSGLDGLSAMGEIRAYDDHLMLVRPFLDLSKNDLVSYCDKKNIPYVQDPSNDNPDYLRPRLRQSMTVLEEEGLSTKRLAVTAKRLARVRETLDELTQAAYAACLRNNGSRCVILSYEELRKNPEEIALRVVQKSLSKMRPDKDYNVRMEKIEELFESLWHAPDDFKPRTLGGCIFTLNEKNTILEIKQEEK